MKSLKYNQNNEYFILKIILKEQSQTELNRWERMRKSFLEGHKLNIYNDMILSKTLIPHLMKVQETVQNRIEWIVDRAIC